MTEPPTSARSDLLADVRILDLTSVMMGPYATQVLADLGADVIMVEPTAGGVYRVMGPGPHPHLSGIALNMLRNKRSVAIDLKSEHGRLAFLRIAATCDVVITNMRTSALDRLGLTYDDVLAVRPDIVWCEAHGYVSSGPDADKPAYDDVIQAQSGIADVMRLAVGQYRLVPSVIADKVCGLTIAYAVLGGVHKRDRTGGPVHLEVPMLETVQSFLLVEHGAGAIPCPPVDDAGYRRVLSGSRGPYRTADGWLSVIPYSAKDWRAIFRLAGRLADSSNDDRLRSDGSVIEHASSLYEDLAQILLSQTTDEWSTALTAESIAFAPVESIEGIIARFPVVEHPVAGDYRHIPAPIVTSSALAVPFRHAPMLGEHTDVVLAEAGLTAAEIDRLAADGVTTTGGDVGTSRRSD